MHRLDVMLFNMAQEVGNTTRVLPQYVMTDFGPVEPDVRLGQCEDFSKYISNEFCKDYENARGKKCDYNAKAKIALKGNNDSNAQIALEGNNDSNAKEGNNDFIKFLENIFALNFQTLCDSKKEEFCSDWIEKLLKAVDSFEVFYDVITNVFAIIDDIFSVDGEKVISGKFLELFMP